MWYIQLNYKHPLYNQVEPQLTQPIEVALRRNNSGFEVETGHIYSWA